MNELINTFKTKALNYYNGLAERERLMVTVLAAVVALLLIYVIISQIFSVKNKYQLLANKNQADYQWMEANIGQAAVSGDLGDSDTAVSRNIRLIANKLMRQHQMAATRTQPAGASGLVMDFKEVEFDAFWNWLSEFKKETNSDITNISVTKSRQSGLSDIRLEVVAK